MTDDVSGHRRHRWLIADGAAAVRDGFREGNRALAEGAWRRWGFVIGIGYVICIALTVAVTETAQAMQLQPWDREVLIAIGRDGPVGIVNAVAFESAGNIVFLSPVTLVTAIIAARRRLSLEAVTVVVSYALQRPLILLGWALWDRARPDVILDGALAPGFHAFPSGHAALSLSVYGFLSYLWVRSSRSPVERLLAVLLPAAVVLVVGHARLALGTHWPSDVLASWLIGLVWLATVIVAVEVARRGRRSRGSPPASR